MFNLEFGAVTTFATGFQGQRYWVIDFNDYTTVLVIECVGHDNVVLEPTVEVYLESSTD